MTSLSASAEKILGVLPADGSMITNTVAMQQSQLDYDSYDLAKKELKDRGSIAVGRGRGGLIGLKKPGPKETQDQGVSLEKELYEHVARYFKQRWDLDHEKPHTVFTIISANQKGPKKKVYGQCQM